MPMSTATTSHARPDATLSATDLLAAVGRGDPAAWDQIVRQYGNLVVAKVRSFRMQDADARDAVQMTWLRLAENAHRVQLPDHLAGWLATTASRECLRILRSTARTASLSDAVTETVADPSVGPEQRALDADTAQTLRTLVAELPPRRRRLLRALFTDNPRPYAEVARAVGIPIGSIGPVRARTLQQLRRRLNDYGLRHAG